MSYLELSALSFECHVGWAPGVKGNSVVPEFGFFSLSLSKIYFGLKIGFPNSQSTVFLFNQRLYWLSCFILISNVCQMSQTVGTFYVRGEVGEGMGSQVGISHVTGQQLERPRDD